MTISQGYQMAQAASHKQSSFDYPLWEQHLEEDIQGIFDRRLGIDNWPEDTEIPDGLISQVETIIGM